MKRFLSFFLLAGQLFGANSLSVTYNSDNKQVAPSGLIFSNSFTGTPTVDTNIANKAYVDAVAGGANYGIGVSNSLAKPQGVRAPAMGAAYQQAAYYFDDFDRADGTLNGLVTPTGQTWNLTGTGYLGAAIVDRKMTSGTNVYAYLYYGSAINRISGTFSYGPGTGTDDRSITTLVLIADAANGGLSTMLHLLVSPSGWTMQQRLSGGAFSNILSGTHNLIADVPYNIGYEIVGNTVTVYPPQGSKASVTSSYIGTINARYGCWQIRPDPNGMIGKWWRSSMGPEQQGRVAAANQSAPAAEVGWLRGSGATTKKRISFTATTNDWYRVATTDNFITYVNMGRVTITASDIYRNQIWKVDASAAGNVTPTLKQVYGYAYSGGSVSAIRLSVNTTAVSPNYTDALDIKINGTQPVDVTVEFEGYFTPVEAPTYGATALPTASSTLTFVSNGSGNGYVSSVGMTVPAFLAVSPATITNSGTFVVSLSGSALPVSNGGTGLGALGSNIQTGLANPLNGTGQIVGSAGPNIGNPTFDQTTTSSANPATYINVTSAASTNQSWLWYGAPTSYTLRVLDGLGGNNPVIVFNRSGSTVGQTVIYGTSTYVAGNLYVAGANTFINAPPAGTAGTYFPVWTFNPNGSNSQIKNRTAAEAWSDLIVGQTIPASMVYAVINAQTGTTYTIQSSDNGKIVSFDNASAITVTIPSLSAPFTCGWERLGAGQVTFVGSGTTLRNAHSQTKAYGQYSAGSLISIDSTHINIVGDTGP